MAVLNTTRKSFVESLADGACSLIEGTATTLSNAAAKPLTIWDKRTQTLEWMEDRDQKVAELLKTKPSIEDQLALLDANFAKKMEVLNNM